MSIKKLLKRIIPDVWMKRLILNIDQKRNRDFMLHLRTNIIAHYAKKPTLTSEEKEVIEYLHKNPVSIFPYDFQEQYSKENVIVFFDESNGLRYVIHENKKLYFKRSYSENKVKSLYHGLQLDQDSGSPHLYLTPDFNLNADDTIADIGAAEGNFSLSQVEKVKKIYLFECDEEWIEALSATFAPWKNKVEILNRFVSNSDSETTISLDKFTQEHPEISFLKVDIEGEESRFLEGAAGFLKLKKDLKIAICTYHKQNDEAEFTSTLKNASFEVEPSKRYMIFYHDKTIGAPFFRRGLLRAQKSKVRDE